MSGIRVGVADTSMFISGASVGIAEADFVSLSFNDDNCSASLMHRCLLSGVSVGIAEADLSVYSSTMIIV
jgi:hypothetical protein